MEGSMIDLSKYRFESAKDDLETAQLLIKDGRFKISKRRRVYVKKHQSEDSGEGASVHCWRKRSRFWRKLHLVL